MVDIAVIGALEDEVKTIVGLLEDRQEECVSGIKFYTGSLYSKRIAVAKCGVGKVFASLCAEAMILKYSPRLLVNTGVGGGLSHSLHTTDIVIAQKLVQHDMDTSPLGDPKGLISGINKVYFEADARAVDIIKRAADARSLGNMLGTVATGDCFVSTREQKERIVTEFGADACEMEGCAIAQVAYVNNTPFAVIRAISDNADESAGLSYTEFLPIAVKNSAMLTLDLIKEY